MKSPDAAKWREAVNVELSQIKNHGTWEQCEVDNTKRILTTSGKVARYKARLVLHGYKLKFGIDFWDTCASIVDYDVAFTVLGYCTSKGAKTHQVDFVTAFLNGDIDEKIYVTLPTGFDKQRHAIRLKKSLYGLKQSPLNWHQKLCEIINDLGFSELISAQ